VVVFPERLPGFILARIGAEFAGDDTLGRSFQREGYHDSLDLIPPFDDEVRIDFAYRMDDSVAVLARMLEAIQRGGDGDFEDFEKDAEHPAIFYYALHRRYKDRRF